MCGILAIFSKIPRHFDSTPKELSKLHRRGPDMQSFWSNGDTVWLGHTRLAIVGPDSGPQPIITDTWVVIINGEIYNGSGLTDCYCVPDLLNEYSTRAPLHMDGIFSFVAYNKETGEIIVARDAIGVTPLYIGLHDNTLCFSSLLSAMDTRYQVRYVKPGHIASFTINETPTFHSWNPPYNPWSDLSLTEPIDLRLLNAMFQSVEKRLMGQVPWGVLLSGGLDSTIVASIASKIASTTRPDYPVVHTFCIGLKDSPDIHWAEMVSKELGTCHTSLEYTIEEGLAAIPEVIGAVETYDVTTIRASVPMWLMGRYLKRRGIKMVLSGEGSDELFAGYLYNLYCPSEREMVNECQRKMEQLHAYDCARANKSLGDFGVETRVPFLDKAVVDFAMNELHPRYKLSGTHPSGKRAEKWYLREVFGNIIPKCVLNRTKAQFSDAVGSKWIDELKSKALSMNKGNKECVSNEREWYKKLFDTRFPHVGASDTVLYTESSIACSSSVASHWHDKFQNNLDPSGDAVAKAINITEKSIFV